MRAAVYHGQGRISVEQVPDPTARDGEIVIAMRACGLCGSDLMTWYQDPRAPTVLGHEPVGEVVLAGEGAGFEPGERVFVHHHVPCFACRLCRMGRHTLCAMFRETRIDPGGLAERIRVPAPNVRADVLRVPDGMSDRAATLIEPLGCVVHGLRLAHVGPGSLVAVVGSGAMGLLQIQAARALGAERVVAIEPRPERRVLAEAAGALALDDASPDAVGKTLGGRLADAVLVCTANRQAIADALHLAGPAGVVQLFAPTPPGEIVGLDLGAIFFGEVELQSTYSAGPTDTRDALQMLERGAVDAEALISHEVPLARVEEAFRLARTGEALKVVVVP